ncbi:type I restriction enzyme, S subunit [Methylobacterium sp. UNC378MF]|uniref:restriction endonuclease subunit S n=1 Tax=Methylobacterium sp. UNC378MF TaxID=1502748 RepID=UPI000889EF02|nr:restriction endonuclease subunit S [Methylobacterium sp. UNC378MF]SDA34256.1 type I restriction enzyme, S subunit [Methylobacterium sp. UNC378MF]
MSDWPKKRLRFLLNKAILAAGRRLMEEAGDVTFLPMEAIGEQGELDTSRVINFDEASAGYTLFFDGDVVVAKITPCFENGKGALINSTATGMGLGTTELYVLRPGASLDGKFLYYITVDPAFRILGETQMIGAAGQKRVPEDFLRNYIVAVPPISEQRQVSRYLDTEIGIIDTLISTKVAWLDLLAEKRRAIVAEAVMRGLNPAAPMRPTGIDWLGDIPAHWEIERSRWLFTERDQRSETGEEEMLTVSHLTGVTPRSEKDVNMFEAESTAGYKLCFAGDLAINTLWAWMGAMGTARVDGIVSPAYNVYTPGTRLLPDYVDALVRIPVFAQEVTRYSKGVWSSRLRLYPEGFFETWWPVPPLVEQHEIVRHIASETAKIDRLRAATEHSITLLKERRGALIAAAVTGQIDISEAA